MVYVFEIPGQPLKTGSTVIEAETRAVPEFTAVNAGTSPVPPAPMPIDVFEFTQLNTLPGGVLIKFDAGTVTPLHTVKSAGTATLTLDTGCAAIVKTAEALQPFADADAVITAVSTPAVEFMGVKDAILPVPLAARPIAGLLLTHVKEAPGSALLNVTDAVVSPWQMV